eukprot:12054423-Alexandrium_andersonii.AAC.1
MRVDTEGVARADGQPAPEEAAAEPWPSRAELASCPQPWTRSPTAPWGRAAPARACVCRRCSLRPR